MVGADEIDEDSTEIHEPNTKGGKLQHSGASRTFQQPNAPRKY